MTIGSLQECFDIKTAVRQTEAAEKKRSSVNLKATQQSKASDEANKNLDGASYMLSCFTKVTQQLH